MKPDITVIVPVYNVEKYITKCLKSLLSQTYDNFEIWAVNDGSPDNSEKIIKNFMRKDSRIKLKTKKNGGYGSVLEYCLNNIKTKYFLICDPDDWLVAHALKNLHDIAQKSDADIIVGDKYEVYTTNSTIKYIPTFSKESNILPLKVYTKESSFLFAFGQGSPHAKLFKTTIARDIKFPTHTSYTDILLYIVSLSKANRVVYYNKPLAYYLIDRPGNTMTNTSEKNVRDHFVVWDYIYNQIKDLDKNGLLLFCLYGLFKFNLQLSSKYIEDRSIKECLFSEWRKIYVNKNRIKKYATNKDNRLKDKTVSVFLFYGFMNKKIYKLTMSLYRRIIRLKNK